MEAVAIEHGSNGHAIADGHTTHIPWILSGLLFITTLLFGGLLLKKNR